MLTRHLIFTAIAAIQIFISACATTSPATGEDRGRVGDVVMRASDFTLRDLDGESHSLFEHMGKQVVILGFGEFW